MIVKVCKRERGREGLWREVLVEKYGVVDLDLFIFGLDIARGS